MSLDSAHVLDHIVVPALNWLDMDSPSARALLMGTAAQESLLRYLVQRRGPAVGLFQMEPETFYDIFETYLRYRPALLSMVNSVRVTDGHEELIWNARLAAMMARLRYRRDPFPLPSADDVQALGEYWKRVYNTEQGKGTVKEFVRNFALVRDALKNNKQEQKHV